MMQEGLFSLRDLDSASFLPDRIQTLQVFCPADATVVAWPPDQETHQLPLPREQGHQRQCCWQTRQQGLTIHDGLFGAGEAARGCGQQRRHAW